MGKSVTVVGQCYSLGCQAIDWPISLVETPTVFDSSTVVPAKFAHWTCLSLRFHDIPCYFLGSDFLFLMCTMSARFWIVVSMPFRGSQLVPFGSKDKHANTFYDAAIKGRPPGVASICECCVLQTPKHCSSLWHSGIATWHQPQLLPQTSSPVKKYAAEMLVTDLSEIRTALKLH